MELQIRNVSKTYPQRCPSAEGCDPHDSGRNVRPPWSKRRRQIYAHAHSGHVTGVETAAPMQDWVEIGVFAPSEQGDVLSNALYVQKHRITSAEQTDAPAPPTSSLRTFGTSMASCAGNKEQSPVSNVRLWTSNSKVAALTPDEKGAVTIVSWANLVGIIVCSSGVR